MMEILGLLLNLAIWFYLGWHFRGIREERRQGELMRRMLGILDAQTRREET